MSQLSQKASENNLDELFQTVLNCISDAEAKIQDEIDGQNQRDDIDKWLEAQQSLEDIKQNLEGQAVLSNDRIVSKQTRQELARLASFPELNPNIVLEINLDGHITYINPTARKLFPDLEDKGVNHPYLAGWLDMIEKVRKEDVLDIVREVQLGQRYYQQSVYFAKEYQCVRVYGLEITQRKQIEHALRINLAKYSVLFNSFPLGITISDRDGKILETNEKSVNLLGISKEKQEQRKIGSPDWLIIRPDGTPMPPEEYPSVRALQEKQIIENVEMGIVKDDNQITWINVTAAHLLVEGYGVVVTYGDITDRKKKEEQLHKLNRTLRAISNSNQALIHAEDEAGLMEEICRIIVDDCGHKMAWIGLAEQDKGKTVRPIACAGFEEGYLETLHITWANTKRGRGPTGTAIRTGNVSMCRNMLTDPAFKPWRAEAIKRGYASSIALPLLAEGQAFGALSIYSKEPDPFSEEEVKLLVELVRDLAFGINSIRTRAAQAQAEEALRTSEEHYRSLFNGMTEGFALHEIICDENGAPCDYRFLQINPAFERLTGLQMEDVVGNLMSQVLPGDDPKWVKMFGQVALTGEPVHFENYSPVLKQHYEVFAYRPAPRQFAVLFLNITERKQTQEALQRAREELELRVQERTQELKVTNEELKIEIEVRKSTEQELRESEARLMKTLEQEKIIRGQLVQAEKNNALARMVASVAHEINNPVQTIKNCMYILQGEIDPASGATEILEMATSETNRIGDLVARLRDLYKPSKEFAPTPFNVLDVLSSIHSLLLPHFQQSHVRWNINSDTNDVFVIGIADQIKQVFLNICLNAVDAMEKKGGDLTVQLSSSTLSQVCISFKDTGKGIPPEDLPHIFEPFYTTKEKGSGLGLSICYEIVKNFNGTILVESKPGEGATFTVCLPRA